MARRWQCGRPSSAAQPALASDGAAQPSSLPGGAEQPATECYHVVCAVLEAMAEPNKQTKFTLQSAKQRQSNRSKTMQNTAEQSKRKQSKTECFFCRMKAFLFLGPLLRMPRRRGIGWTKRVARPAAAADDVAQPSFPPSSAEQPAREGHRQA